MMIYCANCEAANSDQAPYCHACGHPLMAATVVARALISTASASEPRTRGFVWPALVGRKFVCPNPKCDYAGKARRVARGSLLLGILLCFFFLFPGLLYFMFKSGYRYYCPVCGIQIGADI